MSRLSLAGALRPGLTTSPAVDPTKGRCDALSDAALMAKRSVDGLIEQEQSRTRTVAGFVAIAGLLALIFGFAATLGLGQGPVFAILAGVSLLVPIAFALAEAGSGPSRLLTLAHERAWTQGLAVHAKRLGEGVGAVDGRGHPLGPEAVINSQIDTLYRELDRTNQRLVTSGAEGLASTHQPTDRIVPGVADTVLIPADGRRYPVRIAGLSPLGVVLRGGVPTLRQAQQVQIGSRQATVVAINPREIALRFLVPILASEFNPRIVL